MYDSGLQRSGRNYMVRRSISVDRRKHNERFRLRATARHRDKLRSRLVVERVVENSREPREPTAHSAPAPSSHHR